MSDPDARSRRALVVSALAHLAVLAMLVLQMGPVEPPPPDPLEVTLVEPPPPKKQPGGSPVQAAAPRAPIPAVAPPLQLTRVTPPRPLPTPLPPPVPAVREQAPAASGVGLGGIGTGTGRGIGAGTEDDYVARLRRYFNAHSRSVEAPYDAPPYIEVRVVALIDQTGLLLRADLQGSSGYRQVDRAVLDQLRDMSPFPPPPPELHPPFRITMPLTFQTERG
jgi:periplasmic protein TonB